MSPFPRNRLPSDRPQPVVYREQRHEENFAWLWDYLSTHHCACGESDVRVLDLHHRCPEEKGFTIGASLWNVSLETLQAEAAKCDVLCKNCHGKHHSGRLKTAQAYGFLTAREVAKYEAMNG